MPTCTKTTSAELKGDAFEVQSLDSVLKEKAFQKERLKENLGNWLKAFIMSSIGTAQQRISKLVTCTRDMGKISLAHRNYPMLAPTWDTHIPTWIHTSLRKVCFSCRAHIHWQSMGRSAMWADAAHIKLKRVPPLSFHSYVPLRCSYVEQT